jgi:hypothetical protein
MKEQLQNAAVRLVRQLDFAFCDFAGLTAP